MTRNHDPLYPEVAGLLTRPRSGPNTIAARLLNPRGFPAPIVCWGRTLEVKRAPSRNPMPNTDNLRALVGDTARRDRLRTEATLQTQTRKLLVTALLGQDEGNAAELGAQAEAEIAELDLDLTKHFPTLRRQIRAHLAESKVGKKIDELVGQMLG